MDDALSELSSTLLAVIPAHDLRCQERLDEGACELKGFIRCEACIDVSNVDLAVGLSHFKVIHVGEHLRVDFTRVVGYYIIYGSHCCVLSSVVASSPYAEL